MRIVLVNVPHTAIGSRVPDDHLPPLGLLAVGGLLIDEGHDVRLIDAEFGPMPLPELVEAILRLSPDAVLFGHSGSTSAHPTIAAVSRAVAAARRSSTAACSRLITGARSSPRSRTSARSCAARARRRRAG